MPSRQRQHVRSQIRNVLALESLEARALLAGNVTATVSKGTLTIRGDADANQIIISQLSTANSYQLTPIADSGTTINSGSVSVNLSGVQRIDIKLGGGNDVLGFGNDQVLVGDLLTALADYPGAVVNDESSALVVEEDEETIDEEDDFENREDEISILTFFGGGGDEEDSFDIENPDFTPDQIAKLPSRIKGAINIDLGDGDDTTAFMLRTGSNVRVEGGKGSDKILSMLTSAGSLEINTDPRRGEGMGDDLAVVVLGSIRSDLAITSGAQDDLVVVLGVNVSNVGVNSGGPVTGEMTDDDMVLFGNVSASDNIGITTEGGDDNVFIDTIIGDQFRIATGSGDDEVDIVGAALVALSIETADGEDFVSLSPGDDGLSPLVIRRNLTINTGLDDDQVEIDGGLLGLLVGGLLDIRTGSGDDGLLMYRTNARAAFFDLDSGNDAAIVDSLDIRGEFLLNAGVGNDELSVHNLAAGTKLTLKGGTGNDLLHDLGDHQDVLIIQQFEHQDDGVE